MSEHTNGHIKQVFGFACLAVLGALATLGGIAFASNTSGALYTSVITIVNTGVLRTNYQVGFNMSGSSLVDDGFIAANGLNALLTKGGQHIPGMPPTNRIDVAGAVQNDGGVFTDYTTAATSSATNDVPLLPPTASQGDEFYFGMHNPGRILSIDIGQAGVGTWAIKWQYRQSGGYADLSNVVDATNGFKRLGRRTVSYDMPTDWTTSTVTGAAVSAYWMRAVVIVAGVTTTQPLANRAWWENGQWWTWDDSLDTNQQEQYQLHLGGPAMVSNHQLFPGAAGIITPDSAALELGNAFSIQIEGRLSFAATGSGICILCKEGAIKIFPSASNAITLTATGAGVTTLTVSGITLPATGAQTIKAISDSGTLSLEVVGFGSASGTAQTIADNANSYVWGSNGTIVWFEKIQVGDSAFDTFSTQGQWNTGTFSNTESAAGQPTDLEKHLTYFVEASTDDFTWFEGSNEFFNTADSAHAGYSGVLGRTSANIGTRFTNIPVAQGATISSAYLTYQPSNTDSATTVNLRISAIAADNPVPPANFSEAQNAARTAAFVDWNNVPTWTVNVDINTVDIASVIQELVNRSGWASGNAIVLYLEDNGSTTAASTFRRSHTWNALPIAGQVMNAPRLTIAAQSFPAMTDDYIRALDVGTTAIGTSTTNNPLGWDSNGCSTGEEIQIVSATQQFGNYSLMMEWDVDQNSGCSIKQQFAASPGQTWSAASWMQSADATKDGALELKIRWIRSNQTVISTVTAADDENNRFRLTLDGQVAPADTAFARIELATRCTTVTCTDTRQGFFDGALICQCATAPSSHTDSSNLLSNPSFEKIYQSDGTWTSPDLDPQATNTQSATVSWIAQSPSGSTLTAQTSTDGGATFQTVTNGGNIPGISVGQNISAMDLRLRFTLGSTGSLTNITTPFVGFAQVEIQDIGDAELKYELNTLPANTIADRTGHGHTGTMSFPVQLANISTFVGPLTTTKVVLSQEQILGPQSITAAVTGSAVDAQIFNLTETGEFLPGQGLVKVASDNAKIPIAWFWAFFGIITILATGILFNRLFSNNLMVPAIAMAAMILFWGLIGNGLIPLWILFMYIPVALALLILRPRLPL